MRPRPACGDVEATYRYKYLDAGTYRNIHHFLRLPKCLNPAVLCTDTRAKRKSGAASEKLMNHGVPRSPRETRNPNSLCVSVVDLLALPAKQREMAACCHEKQHGEGKVEVHPRRQKGLSREHGRVSWRSTGQCPVDDLLIVLENDR